MGGSSPGRLDFSLLRIFLKSVRPLTLCRQFGGSIAKMFLKSIRKVGQVFKSHFVANVYRFLFLFNELIMGELQTFLSQPSLRAGMEYFPEIPLKGRDRKSTRLNSS